MKQLRGLFAPVVSTFFDESGELDVASFEQNVRAHMASGLHGVVVAGSTGEAAFLDAAERGALVEAARGAVPEDKWIIVGTGAESTRQSLAFMHDAAARGADAVLVVAPHYYGAAMTAEALRQHYRRIADDSPVPVLLYSIPKYMHFALSAELVAELAEHENVIGMKDSSGNRELFASYLSSQSAKFAVLTGNAQMYHHALTLGAPGGILAVSTFAAAWSLEIYDAAVRGDHASAAAAQAIVTPLGATIVGTLGVAGVKAAMDQSGLRGGPVRSPLLPIGAEERSVVERLLRSAAPTTA